jgi:hypothetical protein
MFDSPDELAANVKDLASHHPDNKKIQSLDILVHHNVRFKKIEQIIQSYRIFLDLIQEAE